MLILRVKIRIFREIDNFLPDEGKDDAETDAESEEEGGVNSSSPDGVPAVPDHNESRKFFVYLKKFKRNSNVKKRLNV